MPRVKGISNRELKAEGTGGWGTLQEKLASQIEN